KWVFMHGRKENEPVIQMDLNVRRALGVKVGETHPFKLERLSWIQSLWFPWKASDPMYRLPAQLSIVSFLLGVLLGVLGIIVPFFPSLVKHEKPVQTQAMESPTGLKALQAQGTPGEESGRRRWQFVNMDFVSAWKALSIVFTGGFGILGLVKDFKNK